MTTSTTDTNWVAVIDDDASVRRSVARFIRAQGIPADSYGSADEFLQRTRADQPSCIVLDVQLLRGMSSFALLDRIHADGSRIPVVFMSGLIDLPLEECERYPELRACLRKPFDVGTLISRVRLSLQGSGSATV